MLRFATPLQRLSDAAFGRVRMGITGAGHELQPTRSHPRGADVLYRLQGRASPP